MKRCLPLLAVVSLALAACRNTGDPVPPPVPVPADVPPAEVNAGRISVLGPENAFVVIDVVPGINLKPGEELVVRFAGRDLARIRVTADRKGQLVIADVLHGSVEKGYEVIRNPASSAESTPPLQGGLPAPSFPQSPPQGF